MSRVKTIRSDWGFQNRMAKLAPRGKSVMLAADHGYFLGPTSKLEDPRSTLAPLLPHADAVAVTRGVARTSLPPETSAALILRVSGGASVLMEDLSNEVVTTSVEDAVRLNASAVALSVFVGAQGEHQTLSALGELVNECESIGMPVLGITAVGKELEKRDARYLSLASRICAEFGASMVKTYYCDDFAKVVEACPVPIVIAGGPKLSTPMDAFVMARGAMEAGAIGVDMGRNIWQGEHPVAMIRAIRAIVHDGYTAKEADQLYAEVRSGKSR
ncbi:MAG TPA: 3-hydroxy-5-phosphonooxypentane-2,4-dione thiolase [Candidatus Thermoplasmatota archaeon]|nr:3-hydroxy-5-phosphonooxypentane-2,4-dione thiolase [Candidatus Thermoplasmatota archaeon]